MADRELHIPSVKYDRSVFSINHRTPDATEVSATVEKLKGWHKLAIILLWSTGARAGEVLSLQAADIDLEAGWLTLHGKTGGREVPMSAGAKEALRALLETPYGPGDYLFPVTSTGDYTSALSALRLSIHRACKSATVERFTPHGLRRLAVDTMISSGVEISTAAAITGHSPEVMLRHYRTVSETDKKKAMLMAGLGEVPQAKVIVGPWRTGTEDE